MCRLKQIYEGMRNHFIIILLLQEFGVIGGMVDVDLRSKFLLRIRMSGDSVGMKQNIMNRG